jgi:hypothetical protein
LWDILHSVVKSKQDILKKHRGPPSQGERKPSGLVRLDEALISAIDAWRETQGGNFSRPEAVRRLVELGFTVTHKLKQAPAAVAARAKELAAKAIDKMSDGEASTDDQSHRKRRLLKGPEEFRESRVDRAKLKP